LLLRELRLLLVLLVLLTDVLVLCLDEDEGEERAIVKR
jgi:hypothetical protein